MTCYQRHLHTLFEELDLDYDAANRRLVDKAIRGILEIPPEAHCPEVWAAIKAMPVEDRDELPARVSAFLDR